MFWLLDKLEYNKKKKIKEMLLNFQIIGEDWLRKKQLV